MKQLLLIIPVLLGTSTFHARAETSDDCLAIASAFKQTYFGFPDFDPKTVEQLVSWKASCASGPPQGKGNVVALCQAKMADGGFVFFWTKAAVEAESSGYELCDF